MTDPRRAIPGSPEDLGSKSDRESEAARPEDETAQFGIGLSYALEAAHVGVWDLDLVGHTAFRSLEHDRIFGYDELLPEWTYESFISHVVPEDRDRVDAAFRHAIDAHEKWDFECRIRRCDGEIRWIHAAGQHVPDGGASRMAGIVQDITESKRIAHEARMLEAGRNQRLTLLKDLADFAASSLETQVVAQRCTSLLGERLDAQVVLYMVDESGRELSLVASHGFTEQQLAEYFGPIAIDGSRKSAEVFRANQPAFVLDSLSDDSLSEAARNFNKQLGVRSAASLPLVAGGIEVGVLSLVWPQPQTTDIFNQPFLESIASEVAAALNNAALFDRERTAHSQATRELNRTQLLLQTSAELARADSVDDVLSRLAQLVLEATGIERAFVNLVDTHAEELIVKIATSGVVAPSVPAVPFSRLTERSARAIREARTAILDFDQADVSAEDRRLAELNHCRVALFVPLLYHGEVIAHITVDERGHRHNFTAAEIDLVEGIASQAAIALAGATLLEREHERARLSLALADLDVAVHSSLSSDEVLIHAARSTAATLDSSGAIVFRLDHDEWLVRRDHDFKNPRETRRVHRDEAPFDSLLRAAREPFVLDDPEQDFRFAAFTEMLGDSRPHTVLGIPFPARGEVIGFLAITFDAPRTLTAEEQVFAAGLGRSVSLALENARLYESERAIAHTLQETLIVLPTHVPGIAFSAAYETATYESGRVGGDFIDLFHLHGNCVGIAIGDVAGKGIDAAVVTSMIRNTVRAHALDGLSGPNVAAKTNRVALRFTDDDSFVTMFFGMLDTKTGALKYVSAGHPPVLVLAPDRSIEELATGDPVLGAVDEVDFSECHHSLEPGSKLILYTDGVTEARHGQHGGFLELSGLRELVARHAEDDTSRLADALLAEVIDFSEGVLRDDAAVIVVEPSSLRAEAPDHPQLDF